MEWHYVSPSPYDLSDWLGGQNWVKFNLRAKTENGRTFEGPPVVIFEKGHRRYHTLDVVTSPSPTLFNETFDGVLVQGYTAVAEVRWSYTRADVLGVFGYVPSWFTEIFGEYTVVEMTTKITLTIYANGVIKEPEIVNTSNASPPYKATTDKYWY